MNIESLGFTIVELEQAIEDGFVSVRDHPTEDLRIYNYTAKAQYSRTWNSVTRQCRGLILDHDLNIIALPYAKFFNIEEEMANPDSTWHTPTKYFLQEKHDGWLGILYREPKSGLLSIASRGSFDSSGAIIATNILRTNHSDFVPVEGLTYMFEIIHPETKIVLDYEGKESLVFFGVNSVNGPNNDVSIFDQMRKNGFEICEFKELGCGNLRFLFEEYKHENTKNKEGYVVVDANDFSNRLKIKFENYIRDHRIITQLTPLRVWEALRDGVYDNIVSVCPDEHMEWLQEMRNEIVEQYNEIFWKSKAAFASLMLQVWDLMSDPLTIDRKEFAQKALKYPEFAPILFAMLDKKDFSPIIWKKIRPNS